MSNPHATQLVPVERIEKLIHLARGEKVLLDSDLAKLYGVTTGNLNKAVDETTTGFRRTLCFN